MKFLQKSNFFYVGVLFLASFMAKAATVVFPVYTGSICHGYDPEDDPYIQSYGHGVTNRSTTTTRTVICPLIKAVPDTYGITIRVNVDAPQYSVQCVLRNYNDKGKQLGYQTAKNRLDGLGAILLKSSYSSVKSHFSVVCLLPPNETGRLISLEQVRN